LLAESSACAEQGTVLSIQYKWILHKMLFVNSGQEVSMKKNEGNLMVSYTVL
jgi:hypothetical protein